MSETIRRGIDGGSGGGFRLPPEFWQFLFGLAVKLVEALGEVVAAQVRARYARIAAANPQLDQAGVRDAAAMLGELARGAIAEVKAFAWGDVWTEEEVKSFKRERLWREIVARAAARGLAVPENTARRTAEEALEEDRAEPVIAAAKSEAAA